MRSTHVPSVRQRRAVDLRQSVLPRSRSRNATQKRQDETAKLYVDGRRPHGSPSSITFLASPELDAEGGADTKDGRKLTYYADILITPHSRRQRRA